MALPAALLKAVAALSPDDLAQLRQHIGAMLAIDGQAAQPRSAEHALYQALAAQFSTALRVPNALPPWSVFQRRSSYRKVWAAVSAQALAAHASWFRAAALQPAEELSTFRLYAELVVAAALATADGRGAPGWHHVCWALSRLPVLVEAAFPGYAVAGLLPAVISIRTSGGASGLARSERPRTSPSTHPGPAPARASTDSQTAPER